MVYSWLNSIRSIVYPPHCCLCGGNGIQDQDICTDCKAELPWNTPACLRCALPLPPASAATICAQCLQKPPPYAAAWAALHYRHPIDWLVAQLKFNGRLAHARLLAGLMAERLRPGLRRHPENAPQVIVPVPLHPSRQRERGFNQSLELARHLSAALAIPIEAGACRRPRATAPQLGLSAAERKRNLRGAFDCDARLQDKHVGLLDDVVTTGQTVAELAQTLKRAGTAQITVWACARAPRPGGL